LRDHDRFDPARGDRAEDYALYVQGWQATSMIYYVRTCSSTPLFAWPSQSGPSGLDSSFFFEKRTPPAIQISSRKASKGSPTLFAIIQIVNSIVSKRFNSIIMASKFVSATILGVAVILAAVVVPVAGQDPPPPSCALIVDKECSWVPPDDYEFDCKKGRPITSITMIWAASDLNEIEVVTPDGITLGPILIGDEVTFDTTGYRKEYEVRVLFEGVTAGTSVFRIDCNDKSMNGPKDCGKLQGGGKKGTGINGWLLEGMAGAGQLLECTPSWGTNACEIIAGSTVTYSYKVTNVGDVNILNVKVSDDDIGFVGEIEKIETDKSERVQTKVLVFEDVTNTATVTGTTAEGVECRGTDSVTVTVVA
jgi:hypothetical protein